MKCGTRLLLVSVIFFTCNAGEDVGFFSKNVIHVQGAVALVFMWGYVGIQRAYNTAFCASYGVRGKYVTVSLR